MKFRIPAALSAFLLLISAVWAAQPEYTPAQIVRIQQHTRDRVLLYQGNTPIVTEDPYVAISVDLNGHVYEGEFRPRSRQELLPGSWKADGVILVRLDKHFMYLKRDDGSEAKFLLTGKPRPLVARDSH